MKDKHKLSEYVLEFIRNGEYKCVVQDGKIVQVKYRIGDRENSLTLEDVKE